MSLELERLHHPEVVARLRILAFTQEFPGLPYITDAAATDGDIADMREGLFFISAEGRVTLKISIPLELQVPSTVVYLRAAISAAVEDTDPCVAEARKVHTQPCTLINMNRN